MKNKKLFVLATIPMFLLTSCDKEITKEEAQVKAANVQTAQKTVDFETIKTTIKYSAKFASASSTDLKMTLAVDTKNYFASFEGSGTHVIGENKEEETLKIYYFVDDNEGLVRAQEINGERTYNVITSDPTQYKEIFGDDNDIFEDYVMDSPVDPDDILEDASDGKDLSGSMNSVFKGFGASVTFGAEYSIKYFSNSSSSFGVSMNVSTSASGTDKLVTVSGSSRFEWKDNLLSSVSTKANLTVNKNEYKLEFSESNKYNGKVVRNINLKNYTKVN